MKTANQFTADLNALVGIEHQEPLKLMSTITYNPLQGIGSEEYNNCSIEQRAIYLKSKCKEAEVVILTLSKMFDGDILNLEIPEMNLSIPCILRTHKKLSSKECGHIMAVSKYLEIV